MKNTETPVNKIAELISNGKIKITCECRSHEKPQNFTECKDEDCKQTIMLSLKREMDRK